MNYILSIIAGSIYGGTYMRHKEKSLEYQGFSAGDRLALFECAVLSFAGDERELTDVSERATVCAYIARASRIYENAPSR